MVSESKALDMVKEIIPQAPGYAFGSLGGQSTTEECESALDQSQTQESQGDQK